MSPVGWAWIETAGVTALAALGVVAGRLCSRWRRPWWLVGYVVPLAFLLSISASRLFPWLELRRPFRWLMAGRLEFALLASIITLLMMTLVGRLRHKREKILLVVLMVACVISQSILAFLLPAFNHRRLIALQTIVDADGVCLQNTRYTCGPAAAVTALRRVGVEVEEGELAILAHTTNSTGTQCDSLCHAIRTRYGVPARQAWFAGISELKSSLPAIAVVKYALLVDHFVTVLEVTDADVVIGDPLEGRVVLTHAEFADRWRRCAVVLN